MLHDEESISQPKWYEDVNDWWRGQGKKIMSLISHFILKLLITFSLQAFAPTEVGGSSKRERMSLTMTTSDY
jgi:hypothetical protein